VDLTELIIRCPDYEPGPMGLAKGEVWVMGSPIMDQVEEKLGKMAPSRDKMQLHIQGPLLGFHLWYYARLDKAGHLSRNKSVWNLAEGCPWY